MKAIRVNKLGDPDVLDYQEVLTPEPDQDQFLIEIKAVGVNPVDTYIRAGYQGYDPKVPYTPGFDAAGVVTKVGRNIKEFTKGSRVYLSGSMTGTYAEYALCNLDQVHLLPDHISFAQGASLYVAYVTAYRGLIQKAKAQPKETVLIHGASGAVGIAAIQIARDSGLRVIATASTKEGQVLAKEQGADLVIDHSDPNHFERVKDFTENEGVDVILEMAAHLNLSEDLKILARDGRVIVIGNRDTIEINPRDTMACDGSIIGMSLMNLSEQDEKEIHKAIQTGLINNKFIPVIRCQLSLKDASKAHRMVMEAGACGKIILLP